MGLYERKVEEYRKMSMDKPPINVASMGKPKYYREWLKSHKRVVLYLTESEFKRLKELIGNKDLKSGILDILENYEKKYNEGFEKGFSEGKESWILFIRDPLAFYNKVMSYAHSLGLNQFEPLLFVKRCPECGKPMIFTHTDTKIREIRKTIRDAFKEWRHSSCVY